MERSSTFVRGQVWYWDDPIYGRKDAGNVPAIGEACLRYSRYVIIIQSTNTIGRSSVLVIPCSSNNSVPHDITIPLAHLFHENVTYAKLGSLLPVHPRFLQRYICTLAEPIMKKIEAGLIKLCIPTLYEDMSHDELKEKHGLDLSNIEVHEEYKLEDQSIEQPMKEFMVKHLIRTEKTEDIISVQEMKEAFDHYCVENKIPIVQDIVEFLDSFHRLYSTNKKNENCIYTVTKWECLKFKDYDKSIIKKEKDIWTGQSKEPRVKDKWTDEKILSFLEKYQREELNEVLKEFNLKERTAKSYWSKWKHLLPEGVKKEADSRELFKKHMIVPSTEDVNLSISKVSNKIREYVQEAFLYDEIKNHYRSRGPKLTPEEFYQYLGKIIYFSLLEFLGIKRDRDTGVFDVPTITGESPNLGTWHFFDMVWHDRKVSWKETPLEMMKAYRKHHGMIYNGIDRDWLTLLESKLSHKLNLLDTGTKIISSKIEIFCSSGENENKEG